MKEKKSAKKQKQGGQASSDEDSSWLSSFLLTKMIPRTPRDPPSLDVSSLSSNHLYDPGLVANDTASAGTISTNVNDFPLGVGDSESAQNSMNINGPTTGRAQCGERGSAFFALDEPGK